MTADFDFDKFARAKLDPELAAYVERNATFGKVLRHPLVYDFGVDLPGLLNERLKARSAALKEALDAGEMSVAVFLHERPWRLEALMSYVLDQDEAGNCLPLAQQAADAVDLAFDVWVDSENIYQNIDKWKSLFGTPAPGTLLINDDEDWFEALPDQITVYRGGGESSFVSWTTDADIARRFARISGREIRGRVIAKSSVFAVLTRRGESELLSYEGEGL